MTRERVVLIDGSSMAFRAFYGLPSNFRTSKGLPTSATYGFALMFRKILAGRQPKLGAVIFDPKGPTFRDRRYPEYKAQRPSMPRDLSVQLPWIHKVVEAHDFPILTVPGYEADDVIGTLTERARTLGHEVHIISADKDFAQLIDGGVRMIDTMRDITYDPELVRKKWGVPPTQIVDLFALTGDKIDNVPGVPGIGQKGAAKLLETYGSLEHILASVDELKGRAKSSLEAHRDLAVLSQDLIRIDRAVELPVSLEALTIPEPDLTRVNALYRELEFFSLLSEDEKETLSAVDDQDFVSLTSLDALDGFLDHLPDTEVALFAVHELPSFITGTLVGIALATSEQSARFVPLMDHPDGLGQAGLRRLAAWLEDPAKKKVVHNARDLFTLALRYEVTVRGVVGDTQLASFLVEPTKIIPHRLEQVVREYLHRTVAAEKSILGSGKAQKRFAEVELDPLRDWACHLAAAVQAIWPKVRERLEEAGQVEYFTQTELPLSWVLARMQRCGIRVDGEDLSAMGQEFEARKQDVEAEIHRLAGRPFNIGSTKQLAEVLFEELKLPVLKKTKTGYSTAADVLERLAQEHEIARHILRQRALAKLINTYTRVLQEAIVPETGRVHCTFQQTSGASGRLITTDPDLQRTPIRTEDGARIREAFLPREGWHLISADWSQIELRVLSHFSGDARLGEAFRGDVDVHRMTAGQLFDIAPDAVDAHQRNIGKTVNFATIYGQGANALAAQLGIPAKEAKAYIQTYFERYDGVRTWLDQTIAEAHRLGYVETLLGRRRYIPELSSKNFADRGYGERVAANTPIQGSAADLCKLAMLQIANELEGQGLNANMLLSIHDELLFECPPEELDAVLALVRDRMEHAHPLSVPLKVDIGYGKSWAEAKA